MITAVRANAEQLGSELGRALFDDTLGPFYDEARQAAAANNRGVRLTVSLATTPELLHVPWELLYRRPTFLASQRKSLETPLSGALDAALIKTGERSYCFSGTWDKFDSIVASRPAMIGFLDEVRPYLEDLGNGLGVTDPVSGETVVER